MVPGINSGACTFPLGKTLRAASRQTARCISRSNRTTWGPRKDPVRQKAGSGREKAMVLAEVPTYTCGYAEEALPGP